MGAWLGLLGGGCAVSDSSHEDGPLGGLVKSPPITQPIIDVAGASRDPAQFTRALAINHAAVGRALGSHTFSGSSSVEVREAGKKIEELNDKTSIVFDSNQQFHAQLDNSKDYGRDVFYVESYLYLRPRFGRYHKRLPEQLSEPVDIRNQVYGTLSAYFDLLATGVEVSDKGPSVVAGRPVRRVQVRLAATPRPQPKQPHSQKRWRESVRVHEVSGEFALDAVAGLPLEATLSGTVAFTRDGRNLEMSIEVTHKISDVGASLTIEAPAAEQTVTTMAPNTESADRGKLLRGIAPPERRPKLQLPPANPSETGQP